VDTGGGGPLTSNGAEWGAPVPKPREIVANAPAEERAAALEAIEDELDAELAAERLRDTDAVPWDEAMKELGLG